jgi:hypothetical protein
MEYRIVIHWQAQELSKRVNEFIADGWVPQGGVTYTVGQGNDERFAQAMIREAK